jgi:hypothetical protein
MRRFFLLTLIGFVCCRAMPCGAAEGEAVNLFNGKDLSGWEGFLFPESGEAKTEEVWSVQDGILVCQGKPMGYLATKDTFKNFKLVVEWRWAPGKEPDNSGVLLRIVGEPMPLPKCFEAQLKSGDAGDIWAFQGMTLDSDTPRFREVNHETFGHFVGVAKMMGNEKPPGEWNKYEITLDGDKLMLVVNGKKVNECTGCDVVAGHIGLQSEGAEIHFRTVQLMPLED